MEALKSSFTNHRDEVLRRTNVNIDFPNKQVDFPSIVVRFFGREVFNAGVGHIEWRQVSEDPDLFKLFKHYMYKGDLEFAIYGLSSYDRDLLSDIVVETVTMGDLQAYTKGFLKRIYDADPEVDPTALEHFINLNTDRMMEMGETQVPAPWQPEDVMVYQTSYRVNVFGEFYNRYWETDHPLGLVERVDLYPYIGGQEPMPNPNPDDPAPWVNPDGSFDFTT